MDFTIKILTLYKDFYYSPDSSNTEETLTVYTNAVKKGELEPVLTDFLTSEFFCGGICGDITEYSISKGRYLFIQGEYTSFERVLDAAQELYLESLWQELSFKDDTVYMRTLEEDDRKVFQLFRSIL